MSHGIFQTFDRRTLALYNASGVIRIGDEYIIAQFLGSLYIRQLRAVIQGIVYNQSKSNDGNCFILN